MGSVFLCAIITPCTFVSRLLCLFLSVPVCWSLSSSSSPQTTSSTNNNPQQHYRFVLLGGTGKIGTAVASHLLPREPRSDVVLVGRRPEACAAAVKEVLIETQQSASNKISCALVKDIWDESDMTLQDLIASADCVIHTAGPYQDRPTPVPLKLAIECGCKAYVDVSDPLDFLQASLQLNETANSSKTTAMVAAGAFPGMSNVLAMDAAAEFKQEKKKKHNNNNNNNNDNMDVRFHYFTAGLGGSGAVNLFITNMGFGESMAQYSQGKLQFYADLPGTLLGKVDFFLPVDASFDGGVCESSRVGNEAAHRRVGTRQVFSWPFPEAATVPKELQSSVGASHAAMGTAPELWNVMLNLLVRIVPRSWWRDERFSKWMADFSQPLVLLTDKILEWTDEAKVGETHAMRIDVCSSSSTSSSGGNCHNGCAAGVSIVQAHDSFRQCVGQSCAEFALDCLQHPTPGVYLPEQRYRDAQARRRIIERLTSTPGTFCYTGPVQLDHIPPPTQLDRAMAEAQQQQQQEAISSNG